jgi:hypothetical protein
MSRQPGNRPCVIHGTEIKTINPQPSQQHEVIALLRQARRASAAGKLVKASLLSQLALETLEGR